MKYILVVDDEIEILETIVDTLEIELGGCNVTIDKASSGHEGLKRCSFEGRNYDLIVTDLNMPEMNGVEFTQEICNIQKKVPIIVFTGHGDKEEKKLLDKIGVEVMIKKPYIEDLVIHVKKMFS